MMQALIIVLFLMVISWFILLAVIFNRLKKHHLDEYQALGSPTVLWNNSFRNNLRFAKFLFSRRYRQLKDLILIRICNFMLVLFFVYLILFILVILGAALNWW